MPSLPCRQRCVILESGHIPAGLFMFAVHTSGSTYGNPLPTVVFPALTTPWGTHHEPLRDASYEWYMTDCVRSAPCRVLFIRRFQFKSKPCVGLFWSRHQQLRASLQHGVLRIVPLWWPAGIFPPFWCARKTNTRSRSARLV